MSSRPGIQVPLVGVAPAGSQVWVNGEAAEILGSDAPHRGVESDNLRISFRQHDDHILRMHYPGEMELIDLREQALFLFQLDVTDAVADVEVVALCRGDIFLETAVLYGRADSTRTYSITVDDTADLFAEIMSGNGEYASVFEHPTLRFLRRMHREYGAVFGFYLFGKGSAYATFSLDLMTDRFRREFEENADWLRFGFHAEKMLPPRPYSQAGYEEALGDLMAVREQVFRFAGERIWDSFMRSHYWSGSLESCRAWRDAGIRGLYGAPDGRYTYYLTPEANRVLKTFDYWRDNVEDIVFVQTDIWIEDDLPSWPQSSSTPQGAIRERLAHIRKWPRRAQNMQLFTHESFLLPRSAMHRIPERIEAAILWLTEQGYAPRLDAEDPFLASLPPAPPYNLRAAGRTEAVASIAWDHTQVGDDCRYLVYRKDLAHPQSPWDRVGETVDRSFADRVPPGRFAYRVFAVDGMGKKSGGSRPLTFFSGEAGGPCRADFNGDGSVNSADFFLFLQHFGRTDFDAKYDLTADGQVSFRDFVEFAQHFGRAGCP